MSATVGVYTGWMIMISDQRDGLLVVTKNRELYHFKVFIRYILFLREIILTVYIQYRRVPNVSYSLSSGFSGKKAKVA